jgi:hypothetical protein
VVMAERRRRAWVLSGVCLLAAGCGGHAGASRSVGERHGTAHLPARARRCAEVARLTPGASFPAWHMGAVQFFSASSGVGITAERFPCFRGMTGGANVTFQSQTVHLASTGDAGRSWRITGVSVPLGVVSGGVSGEQVAATSPTDVWAIVGKGRLVATRDGGSHWLVQAIPTPVAQIATSGGVVWALTCPRHALPAAPVGCQPELWHTSLSTTAWTRVTLPSATAEDPFTARFALTRSNIVIELLEAGRRPDGLLLVSHDTGRTWTKRGAPAWDHNECDNPADVTAASPRTFWLLCLGGAAAGSSTKGLLKSTDAGQTWRTASAATSLTRRPHPGSIPFQEPSALAAGSKTRLWLSLTNGFAESNDGGQRWTNVPQAFDPGGWETVIDDFSASHAWVLAPGAGMWRTNDGLDWRPIRPLNAG